MLALHCQHAVACLAGLKTTFGEQSLDYRVSLVDGTEARLPRYEVNTGSQETNT